MNERKKKKKGVRLFNKKTYLYAGLASKQKTFGNCQASYQKEFYLLFENQAFFSQSECTYRLEILSPLFVLVRFLRTPFWMTPTWMIVFRYLLYLILYLFFKYVTHTCQYLDILSISKLDFIGILATVLSVRKLLFLHCTLHHIHFHQPLRVVRLRLKKHSWY